MIILMYHLYDDTETFERRSIMVKKINNIWEDNRYIIYSFLATAGTMLIIFFCNQMVPFGDKTILRMDLYHQYGPLFAELYERVVNGASLTYSWISGLGSCFLGNYFNYLSSPIGAIIMVFGHKNMPEAIAAMILIKAALSASTFTYYLKRSLKSQSFVSTAFGIMYAFCAYMLAYYWNVMWLDAMVLLPIVLLGIERIINHGRPATYIVGLSLTMLSNYYMSYMLCIFSVIYFIYYFASNNSFESCVNNRVKDSDFLTVISNNKFLRSGTIFALASFAAAGLMACVLLPVYGVLQSSSATSGTFPTDPNSYFKFFDFFANHFGGLTTTIRSSGDDVLPNVYCGVLAIILAPLYFFTKTISKKEKIATLSLLAVIYFSFNINILNYIWHGFHYPNDLPYRQSFIYSFILLVMAYKTFIRLKEFKTAHIGIVGAAMITFVVFVEKLTSKNVTDSTILLTMILIVLYVIVLTVFKDKRYQAASVAALLVVCVCSEAVMCDTTAVSISVDKTPYVSDLEDFESIKKGLDTIEGDDFYRMELTDLRTRMDPSWYYYNGVSVFSSMASEPVSNLQDDLGMMSNRINSYTYNPQTPVYNMMFSLKYLVNNETPNVLSAPYYSTVIGNDTFEAYKFNYNLPIAYCVNNEIADWATEEYMDNWKFESSEDPFQLQGEFFNLATGYGNPFEKIDISYITYSNIRPFTEDITSNSFYFQKDNATADASTTFYITTEKAGNVYIGFDITGANNKDVVINSSLGTITQNGDQECILDLGRYEQNETISVTIPYGESSGTVKLFVYTINDKVFKKGYEKLSNGQIITETFEDTYIKGTVVTTDDSILYTSIPYDKGWKVFIDGSQVTEDDILKIGDAMLAVNIERGSHTVEFKFEARGLKLGFMVSLATAIILLVLYLINKKRSQKGMEPLLPAYPKMGKRYTTKVFLPKTKNNTLQVLPKIESIRFEDVSSLRKDKKLPEREIIRPRKEVKREIISPDNK